MSWMVDTVIRGDRCEMDGGHSDQEEQVREGWWTWGSGGTGVRWMAKIVIRRNRCEMDGGHSDQGEQVRDGWWT